MGFKLVICCTSWCRPAYERCADGGVAGWVAFGGANSREEAADVGSWAATQVAASHSIAFWLGIGLWGRVWARVRVRVRVRFRVRVGVQG